MKVIMNSCFILLSILNALLLGQIAVLTEISSNELTNTITWNQIVNNSKNCFLIGSKERATYLLNINDKASKCLFENPKLNKCFISDNLIYFASLGDHPDTINKSNEIVCYNLDGNFKEAQTFFPKNCVIDYYFSEELQSIVYISVMLDEFMDGKTGLSLNGGIFIGENEDPIININCVQPKPPMKMILPVVTIKNNVYLSFNNKYEIEIYSINGEKLRTISYPNFQNKPYSKDEVSLLPPMLQSVITEGITLPPIINKIDTMKDESLIVTRYKRPGDNKVSLDIFNSKGEFLKTYQIRIDKNESIIDNCVYVNDIYTCLIFSSQQQKYFIRSYQLNSNY